MQMLQHNLIAVSLLIPFITGCRCDSTTTSPGSSHKGLSNISLSYEPAAGDENSTGSIAGELRYVADAERPWRYGKYHLGGADEGALAGAVVCLSSRPLAKWQQENRSSQTWKMNQRNHTFTPEVLAIQVGDKVEFINSDKVIHNVNAQCAIESFNLTTPIADAETYEFKFAGNENIHIPVRCNFHSQMHARIYVFSHPFHQVTGTDGQFVFDNVPAGNYHLVVIHPTGRLQSKDKLTVKEHQKLVLNKTVSPDDLLQPAADN